MEKQEDQTILLWFSLHHKITVIIAIRQLYPCLRAVSLDCAQVIETNLKKKLLWETELKHCFFFTDWMLFKTTYQAYQSMQEYVEAKVIECTAIWYYGENYAQPKRGQQPQPQPKLILYFHR